MFKYTKSINPKQRVTYKLYSVQSPIPAVSVYKLIYLLYHHLIESIFYHLHTLLPSFSQAAYSISFNYFCGRSSVQVVSKIMQTKVNAMHNKQTHTHKHHFVYILLLFLKFLCPLATHLGIINKPQSELSESSCVGQPRGTTAPWLTLLGQIYMIIRRRR